MVEVVLEVAAMPEGSVRLDPPGEAFGGPFDLCAHDDADGECRVTYEVDEGASKTVRLTAVPGQNQTFHGWSTPQCGPTSVCTIELKPGDDRPEVWAVFSPATFEVLGDGHGTVTGANGAIDCSFTGSGTFGEGDCTATGDPGAPVTLTAQGNAGAGVTWVFGCDPGDDPHAASCTVRPENRYVGVVFGDGVVAPPFSVQVSLRVVKSGSGAGTVTGEAMDDYGGDGKIDCGSTCVAKPPIEFGGRVRLTAVAGTGSHFVRWTGAPCSTQRTCVLNAGPITAVGAVFDEDARPAPPPPPPTPTASTAATTGVSTTPKARTKLQARLLSVSWRRVNGRYRVLARVESTKLATARLRVLRGTRLLGQRTVPAKQGRRTLWVALARSTRSGPARLQVRLVDRDGQVVTVGRKVTLGR